MKKRYLSQGTLIILSLASLYLTSCKPENTDKEYLQSVLNKLDQIQTASYILTGEAWAPGDSAASQIHQHFVKEFDNPKDTAGIGSCFVKLNFKDPSQFVFAYDGVMRATAYDEHQTIVIDSFRLRKLPFRPVTPPFFNYAKNIIRYALETHDSIKIQYLKESDTIHLVLTIFEDRQVEFFGKAHYIDDGEIAMGETTSKYEIWIDPNTQLPYRTRREMSHDISVESVRDVEINKLRLADFNATDYFQPNFKIEQYSMGKPRAISGSLLGQVAPDWILKNSNGDEVSLKSMTARVVMIQFTGISCGPCRKSIPFLKQLLKEYTPQELDLVAIESFNRNTMALNSYQQRNHFNYPFLVSSDALIKAYQINSIPVFYILDENRIIRKIIHGYGNESTDKEIKDAIQGCL